MATDGDPLTKLVDHPCLTDAGKTGSDKGVWTLLAPGEVLGSCYWKIS